MPNRSLSPVSVRLASSVGAPKACIKRRITWALLLMLLNHTDRQPLPSGSSISFERKWIANWILITKCRNHKANRTLHRFLTVAENEVEIVNGAGHGECIELQLFWADNSHRYELQVRYNCSFIKSVLHFSLGIRLGCDAWDRVLTLTRNTKCAFFTLLSFSVLLLFRLYSSSRVDTLLHNTQRWPIIRQFTCRLTSSTTTGWVWISVWP